MSLYSQGLGFKTIAEGVETQRQRDYLEALDVDEIQGFWLAKPMTADRLGTFVASIGRRLCQPR
ncbi:EAL domain-containing protein [Billgrantia desiderata]|uniref:EAL domain-containing protein n=1 Tax=Billgrantia desiderata TaxID=52021 RepID=UPI001F16A0D9|nr:EAL domain-containing protein [Halomonas desiderata]